jgi:hypothetical protein
MAATTNIRTLTLHTTGDDVSEFQRLLNHRFAAWKIGRRVVVDGDYGDDTREAAEQVCLGLGIDPKEALRDGVTPDLRIKLRHPKRRTPAELERSKGAAARNHRAQLRRRFAPAVTAASAHAGGVATFDGKQVAAWIVPSLRWARNHGWTGSVTSGFRTCAHQTEVAKQFAAGQGKTVAQIYPNGPCASNHVGTAHPRGAVDVSQPAQLADVLRNNPSHPKLVWGGPVIGDQVHFSATGH